MTQNDILGIVKRNQRSDVRYNRETERSYFALVDCISKVTVG